MLFLGTGAAELVPNPFCSCELCTRLRRENAIPRKRSALLVDPELCIDFGPDVLSASQQHNAPLDQLKDILITHTHEDHLCIDNLCVLTMTGQGAQRIRLWLSPEAAQWLEQYRSCARQLYGGKSGLEQLIINERLSPCVLLPYQWHEVGNARVFAIVTNHPGYHTNEFSLNYVVEKSGSRLLYAADTGLYSEENLQALKDFGCDTVVMEGTYGSLTMDRGISHLTCETYIENAERLISAGAVKSDARFYVTHINQCHSFNHAEYQSYMTSHSELPITVAYDGLEIL